MSREGSRQKARPALISSSYRHCSSAFRGVSSYLTTASGVLTAGRFETPRPVCPVAGQLFPGLLLSRPEALIGPPILSSDSPSPPTPAVADAVGSSVTAGSSSLAALIGCRFRPLIACCKCFGNFTPFQSFFSSCTAQKTKNSERSLQHCFRETSSILCFARCWSAAEARRR